MAPPRRILRQQLEILMDFLEENKDMSKGLPPGAPVTHQATRQKWATLAKQLNTIPDGAVKTSDGWKKYWFEWRHKCRRKAADARRFQSAPDGGPNRFVPLNDLEVRVLALSGKGSVTATVTLSNKYESVAADDSDSEQNHEVPPENSSPVNVKTRHSISSSKIDEGSRAGTPPPRWALELEERRIAAEERMADALESMAATMRTQEERRSILDERVADAVTAIAGTIQDLNSGIQEALQHLQQLQPIQSNGPDIKDDIFS
ncbi:uncharacterized protein [Epargyreus clarus]|uniref:uncharacterized protein n=1 Tax=Epargyreus clarus TaxID=520877 RepID=UPI003C307F16